MESASEERENTNIGGCIRGCPAQPAACLELGRAREILRLPESAPGPFLVDEARIDCDNLPPAGARNVPGHVRRYQASSPDRGTASSSA